MPHPDLTPDQRRWYDKAVAQIDVEALRDLNRSLTSIHSPTGRERDISTYLAEHMRRIGLEASYQPMGPHSGNAFGRRRGTRTDGTSLLLYAPIDTHLEGSAEDVPWVGPELRADMAARAEERDGAIIGLGASNPKAMATTLAEAVRAICQADVPLAGDLILAYAGGGMPVDLAAQGYRGLSDGVSHLLTRGVYADYGLVMKPGNAVYHEEPGLCWFKISVKGTLGYAGINRAVPGFRSSIVPAARLILELEDWLPEYTRRNASGQVAPQGWISCVRAGWPERVSFPSATTEIYLDVRCHPRTSPAEVRAQFAQALEAILARHPEIELSWDMVASLPGASTDPQAWIIHSAVRGFEEVEGRPHPVPRQTSGQTDISMIRNLGIPTARIGWLSVSERTPEEFRSGLGGMGVSYPDELVAPCRKIIYAIIDTCMRTRSETGAARAAL